MRPAAVLGLLIPLFSTASTVAEVSDFCRATCFSEKGACRKNAEQLRSDAGGSPAVAASLALALSARPQSQALVQAGNNADWQASSSLQGRREEQSAMRNDANLACDAQFSQCVDACRR